MRKDSGTSTAAAFVFILAVFAIVLGIWTATVIPVELHEKEEKEMERTVSALTDLIFLMQALPDSLEEDMAVSLYLSKGTVQVTDAGEITVGNTRFPLKYLSVSHTGDTSAGILAGGIWRKDGADAAWIRFPKITCSSKVLSLSIPSFSKDTAYGSSNPVPLSIAFAGKEEQLISEDSVLTVTAEEEWILQLWNTLFQETAFAYEDVLTVELYSGNGEVSAVFSAGQSPVSLEITEMRYLLEAGGAV